jgi:hypothetical protein
MDSNLFIYEFPQNTTQDMYQRKAYIANNDNFSLNSFDEISNKLIYLKDITLNANYKRDINGQCTNDNTWDLGEPSDYDDRSCDPLLFEFNIKETEYNRNGTKFSVNDVNNYKHNDVKNSEVAQKLINLGLLPCKISSMIANIFILPEMSTISVFGQARDNFSILTKNFNLKVNDLTANSFLRTLNNLLTLYDNVLEEQVLAKYIYDSSKANKVNPNHYNDSENYNINYACKLHLSKDSHVCFFGDIHGAIHSLARSILRLIFLGYMNTDYTCAPNFYIIFLGDLVDRSVYSIETLFLIMELKLKNPNNIFIIKGNHENCCTSTPYKLDQEFKKLDIGDYLDIYNKYCYTWLHLPVAIFLKIGDKPYIQLCHGGLYRKPEIIKEFLESENMIKVFSNYTSDFQWSSFTGEEEPLQKEIGSYGVGNSRRKYYLKETIEYLNITGIRFVIRGHDDISHNTKVNVIGQKDFTKIESVATKELLRSDDGVSSFKIPVLDNAIGADDYINNFTFLPVITLTTGIPSRFVDADGFAILKSNDIEQVEDQVEQLGGKYKMYKNKYLKIKQNLNMA